MKKNNITILLLVMIGIFTACENDKFYYQDEPRARIEGPYIWALGTDSLSFSFATYPKEIEEQHMEMVLYVMGEPTTYERVVKLEIDDSKTTANSSQYELPLQVTIPSGKLEVPFFITLKRTAELIDQTVSLSVKIIESEDFKVGVNEQNHFLLSWNDILGKPVNWDTKLKEFFGEYSLVKYRFIIDSLGFGEFKDSMSWSEMTNYKIKMITALTAYNEKHPEKPLTDENGQLVTFK